MICCCEDTGRNWGKLSLRPITCDLVSVHDRLVETCGARLLFDPAVDLGNESQAEYQLELVEVECAIGYLGSAGASRIYQDGHEVQGRVHIGHSYMALSEARVFRRTTR